MKFVDKTEIFIQAGDGGNGLVSFKRAKNKPRLGPDGGDGGHGGSVYLIGNKGLNTLCSFRYRATYKAERGERGGINGCTGACGADLYLPVPLGTVVTNPETGDTIAEVLDEGESILIAKGGKRGMGNMKFLTATHQAPEESTAGTPGEELTVKLELKLIADVGIAGLPNAGKSTLLSSISAARPKVADYPFTTLTPQLGVVTVGSDIESESFVMADIPGLIEGAGHGKGLGHEFLRHVERTKALVVVIDGFTDLDASPTECYEKLMHELGVYDPDLQKKPLLVVINKLDIASQDFQKETIEDEFAAIGIENICFVSAATGGGTLAMKRKILDLLKTTNEIEPPGAADFLPSLADFRMVEPHAAT